MSKHIQMLEAEVTKTAIPTNVIALVDAIERGGLRNDFNGVSVGQDLQTMLNVAKLYRELYLVHSGAIQAYFIDIKERFEKRKHLFSILELIFEDRIQIELHSMNQHIQKAFGNAHADVGNAKLDLKLAVMFLAITEGHMRKTDTLSQDVKEILGRKSFSVERLKVMLIQLGYGKKEPQ